MTGTVFLKYKGDFRVEIIVDNEMYYCPVFDAKSFVKLWRNKEVIWETGNSEGFYDADYIAIITTWRSGTTITVIEIKGNNWYCVDFQNLPEYIKEQLKQDIIYLLFGELLCPDVQYYQRSGSKNFNNILREV